MSNGAPARCRNSSLAIDSICAIEQRWKTAQLEKFCHTGPEVETNGTLKGTHKHLHH